MYNRKYIVAHRGLLNGPGIRENTLPAFVAAARASTDYFECDLRRSADGVVFVHHDPTVGCLKTCNSSFLELMKEAAGLGYQLPRLSEILNIPNVSIKVDFELKEPGYELNALADIRSALADDRFVLTTFYDESIRIIKHAHPTVRCGLLLGLENPAHLVRTRLRELFPVNRAIAARADFLAPHWRLLRCGFLSRARRAKLPVWVWTVNEEALIMKLLAADNVEAIITDIPMSALSLSDRCH